MSYTEYDAKIRVKYHVELRGWPLGVRWGTPSSIGAVDDIRSLREALVSGECRWVRMSRTAQETLAQQATEVPPKQRKTRSDKGKKRAPKRKVTDENEPEGVEIRQKRAKRMLPPGVAHRGDEEEEEEDA